MTRPCRHGRLAGTLTALALACAGLAWLPRVHASPAQSAPTLDVRLPLIPKSVRFGVIGDSGTGDRQQFQIASLMQRYRQRVGFDFVIMLGDNIYGGHSPADFTRKFQQPYQALLDSGVKFYAALGNHDDPHDEEQYKPFGMNGHRYYDYKKGNVTFFALDSDYMDPAQIVWLTDALSHAGTDWKICYFHHPLYSDAKFHGSDLDLRKVLQPLFERYGVNVVFSGHDHVYERIRPQDGIYYFVEGESGQLRYGNLRRGVEEKADGFDTDRSFMLVEIAGDKMYFQTISRTGLTVDSGTIPRQGSKNP